MLGKFVNKITEIPSAFSYILFFKNLPKSPTQSAYLSPLSVSTHKTQRAAETITMLTSSSSSSSSLHHSILHTPLHSKTLSLTPSTLKFQPNPKPQLHHHCLVGTSILSSKRYPNIVAMSKSPKVEEQKFSAEGLVTESLPNGMFRIRLDNADTIIGYISGKIRKSFIRILPGDRVKVEVSRYDTTRGRIVYRLRNTRDSP